jgi:predicted ATPase
MHLKSADICPDRYPTTEHYPFNLETIARTKQLSFKTPVTFFVGENGTGKSTLLKAMAYKCGIYIWGTGERRMRYEHNPYEEKLYTALDIEWADGSVPGSYFDSQIFKNFSQILDEWASADPGVLAYFGGESLMTKSHGQSLMTFFKSRYTIKGIYLMDEPETALSPKSQLELLKILSSMTKDGHAQFIIATHSPILLACPGATIYSFDHIPIKQINYEDTEYYQVYKDFMDNRKKYLEKI